MTMTPTLLVTGATGTIGGDALARMLAADASLRAFVVVRAPERWAAHAAARGIDAARTEPVRGDLRKPGLGLDRWTRARMLDSIDTVLHAAGTTSFSQPLATARATNVEGTWEVVRVAGEARRAVRFGFVSSAFVAGRRTGPVAERDTAGGAGWVNAYEQSKAEAESIVRGYAGPWTIFRPSTVVYDAVHDRIPQYNAVHRALRLCWHGLAPMLPGAEDTPIDVVTSDYVAGAIARLLPRADLGGRTVHLCAGVGAMALGELIDRCWRSWQRHDDWRRRALERPALASPATYRLFERGVMETGDDRLRRVVASLAHFAPQLALPKIFETASADALLGQSAPPVRSYWSALLDALRTTGWGTHPFRRAA
jgi:nucleoside-diphosphate-sugar epimerase